MCLKRSITLILIQELLGTCISCFYDILIREILHYVISYCQNFMSWLDLTFEDYFSSKSLTYQPKFLIMVRELNIII